MRRFEATWSACAHASDPVVADSNARWTTTSSGPDWQVATDFHLFRWDDIISDAAAQPLWRRMLLGLMAIGEFIMAGALWRYLRFGWRYVLFFFYPALLLAAFAGAAASLGALIAVAGPFSSWTAVAGAVSVFLVLLFWPGKKLHLHTALDDWAFSQAYLRGGHPVLDERLDRVAAQLISAEGSSYDEILVIGHSLGAVLAVHMLERALRANPELGKEGPRIAFVAVGSSILKVGFHDGATALRNAILRLGSSTHVFWGEYQALADIMNFYKTDPVRELGLAAPTHPLVRTVSIRSMLDDAAYRRIRLNFFRMHRQFVSGNTRRARYDYFMLVCGPLSAEAQLRSPDGAASAFANDGTFKI